MPSLHDLALRLTRFEARTLNLRGTDRALRWLYAPDHREDDALRYVGQYGDSMIQIDTASFLEWSLYAYGAYEAGTVALLEGLTHSGAVVFDVGANVGIVTLPLARAAGAAGHLHAFEPHPALRARLIENCALNNLRQVTVSAYALGSEPGSFPLYASTDANQGTGSLRRMSAQTEEIDVTVTTLDAYVAEQNIERLDVIKIDTEGADLDVLRGAVCSLERFKPAIYVEVSPEHLKAFGATPSSLYDFLTGLGYRVWRNDATDTRERRLSIVTAGYAASGVHGMDNWLAVHPGAIATT